MRQSSFGKAFAIGAMLLLGTGIASAQEKKSSNIYGVANRVGIGVGAGTEGIGVDVAVPITKYLQARVGVNVIPNINVNTTATATVEKTQGFDGGSYNVDVTGKLKRTSFDVKLDCYPFGNSSSFFITGGFSMGGGDLLTITGHSEELKQLYAEAQSAGKQYGIEIGDYQIPVDKNGDVSGGVKVKNFRPYLGLGFGRLIPKKRFGVRLELGAQFQGAPKVYADGVGDLDKVLGQDTDDDISKIMDYLKVYPVLKLSFRGRIL